MHRAGEATQIAALLREVEDLAELGRIAQDDDESRAEPAVRQLQSRYPAWYGTALAVLPDDLRARFVEQYDAKHPTVSPRIKQFIAHPRQPWVLYHSVPKFFKSHGRWQHSLKQSYEEPLFEQRRLLQEASGRFGLSPGLQQNVTQLTGLFRRLPESLALLALEQRHRPGFVVTDEYDLQRILHAVLRLHFDDVEPEETTPRRAGGSYRIDFVLRREQIAVEAKMTRPTLGAKQIRSQIVDDMFGYRGQANVAALVVVVYDRDRVIQNPTGFEKDINTDDPELLVRVVVAQG
ncbi:hypothetical protein Acor_70870 [Acrocarpospora corrugata]|uniref:Uncharacterized protein n=1 Tax=Acrocarpospora corrugata TaxID=35763 RepID=A0A5M3W9I5_9ACTN|nr:hypothetical protein [Acrocarpospora corrugata]GES05019.1 hypothetical protein Acor_70870 [Acrocarpospora corrugata]